jgi:hypothetical protein
MGDIGLGAPAGCTNNVATAAAARCFPELDPLVLELRASMETPAWVELMLEEPAASLVVSLAGAPAPGSPPVSAVASQDADASRVDTRSPAKAAHWTSVSPPKSPVQGPPQVTPVKTCLDPALVEAATLRDATVDVTAHDGRTPPMLPKRSRRIAVQSISHILASKQDGHLVLKRLGLTSGMSSPSTSALKAYDEIYGGDPGNMQALRELFSPDGDIGGPVDTRYLGLI